MHIQSISKKAAQFIGSIYRASRYLPPQSILYLYKSTIDLNLVDRVEKRAKNLIGQPLANQILPLSARRNVASLSLFTVIISADVALR